MAVSRLPRRAAAGFLIVIACLFGVLWLGQIGGAITSGDRERITRRDPPLGGEAVNLDSGSGDAVLSSIV